MDKVIIVEGTNDRKRVRAVLDEPVEIICTHGTLGDEKMESLIIPLEDREVYILVDEDDAGKKLRKQLLHELPNAIHLYTQKGFRQVETTPYEYLIQELRGHFKVKESF